MNVYSCQKALVFLTVAIDDTSFRSSSELKFCVRKQENENIKRKSKAEQQVLSCHKDVVNMKSVGLFAFLLIWFFAKNCADFIKST